MSDPAPSILMVAGEASGDLHASKVVARLKAVAPGVPVYGVGGERMASAGMDLRFHAADFALVGFAEVLRHLPRLTAAMRALEREAVSRRTRLAILVDYPGFNLALARRLKRAGVRILYYISPQVWAWGESRVAKIASRVDRMAVVLPFEEEFYRARGVSVEFVGHPLLEEPWVNDVREPRRGAGDPPLLGLLPGSRRQEVARHLPAMVGAASILRRELPELDVRIGLAPGVDRELVDRAGGGFGVVEAGAVHGLMERATALLVSSGTATLEAACAGAPMVITYRMSALSYALARSLVRIPDIGLVNVVAGERVVPEVLQREATAARLAREVRPYLTEPALIERTSLRLLEVRSSLGRPGASDRVARMALSMLGERR